MKPEAILSRETLIARGYKVAPSISKPGKFSWSQNNGMGQVKSYSDCSDFDTEEQAWLSAQKDLEESALDSEDGTLHLRSSLANVEAQARALDASLHALQEHLLSVVKQVIKPGFVLAPRQFGRISVVAGNSRGAVNYEVAEAPTTVKFSPQHPTLARFLVNAWPLNAEGKRLSGRAGNSSRSNDGTVSLAVEICRFNLDDPSPDADILVRGVQHLLSLAKEEALKAEVEA